MAGVFEYKAFDQAGRVVSGTIEAATADEVATRLRLQGYFPSSVAPLRERRPLWRRVRRLRSDELAVFARQFAIMMETGLPVVNSLGILAGQQLNPSAKQALEDVRRHVSGGQSLADGMQRHPHVFPQMFLDMVEVGELSGNLPEIFDRMATFYERDAKLRGDVKQALTYPSVIVAFAIVAIGVVMFGVLPTFADMFGQFGVELPLVTRIVIMLRDWLVTNILWVAIGAVAALFALRAFVNSDRGRLLVDALLLRLPVVGPLVGKVVLTRFARTLSLLYTSGVSMVQALESCERIVGNKVVARDLERARYGVQRGEGVSAPLKQHAQAFPRMLIEMMAVGEETGSLDKVLGQVADFYDVEVEQSVKTLTSVIEPVVMVLLGAVIFLLVLSVFVPMFSMVDVIQ